MNALLIGLVVLLLVGLGALFLVLNTDSPSLESITPGDTTPGDTTPGDTTPGDTTPGDTTPGDTTLGDTTLGDTTLGDTTLGDTTLGDTTLEDATTANGANSGGVKTFVLTGENFKFVMNGNNNPEIRVQQGDIVRIEFSSTQGLHDWVVDEFGALTDRVRDTDGSTFVEFVVDQRGTFEYYCSVGTHRQQGMEGSLIVE
jgi:plastocyanin